MGCRSCLVRRFAFLLLLFLIAIGARAQSAPLARPQRPPSDPTIDAIHKAEREGRLVDAKKLLEAAVQDAEAQPGSIPRLHTLLSNLVHLDIRTGHPEEAVAVAKRMVEMDEREFGPDSPNVARDLSELGLSYDASGDVPAAGNVYERQLALARKLGRGHLIAMMNLSNYYLRLHRTADAQPLLTEAVQICDAFPGQHFPDYCPEFRNRLAEIYRSQGRTADAEQVLADAPDETVEDAPNWQGKVHELDRQAERYKERGANDLAETAYRQAVTIAEQNTRPGEPSALPYELDRLGVLLQEEGRNAEAEELYKRALQIQEQTAKSKRPEISRHLPYNYLVSLYRSEGRGPDLEPILKDVLSLQEQLLGPEDLEIATTLIELAGVYQAEGKYRDAEPLYPRAIAILEKNLGADSPRLLTALGPYANLLRELGDSDKAQAIAARAEALRRKSTH